MDYGEVKELGREYRFIWRPAIWQVETITVDMSKSGVSCTLCKEVIDMVVEL